MREDPKDLATMSARRRTLRNQTCITHDLPLSLSLSGVMDVSFTLSKDKLLILQETRKGRAKKAMWKVYDGLPCPWEKWKRRQNFPCRIIVDFPRLSPKHGSSYREELPWYEGRPPSTRYWAERTNQNDRRLDERLSVCSDRLCVDS